MITWFVALFLALRWRSAARTRPRHAGATEDWSPAAEMAEVPVAAEVAPDWDTNVWTLDVHAALNGLMDDFTADVEHIWARFYEWLGIDDARTLMTLAGVSA